MRVDVLFTRCRSRASSGAGPVAAGVVLLLLAAGCGVEKLTATETESRVRRDYPNLQRVRCVRGDDVWDYFCSYSIRLEAGVSRETIGVRVDDELVTGRSAP